MKIYLEHLKHFLPNLTWDSETLATNLSMIGHEAELDGDALEVKIAPNRGDALSLRGLSRDLAAIYPGLGVWQDVASVKLPVAKDFYPLTVTAAASKSVWNDHLLKIENYQPTKSPPEIVKLLTALNLQPKDLLIDLTNIVAYEVGLPLHAFDFDKVAAGMTIDLSREEDFTALNSRQVALPSGLLVARTSDEVVADLVGTIGGANSALGPTTQTVLLQAAAFDGKIIRKNSRETGIATEASYRYQRGVDPELVTVALGRFVYLLQETLPKIKITGYQVYGAALQQKELDLITEDIVRLLGTEVSAKNIADLTRLGFKVDGRQVTVPSWRLDIESSADIAEEIARLIGLNKVKPKILSKGKAPTVGWFEQSLGLKHRLAEVGYSETLTYSFTPNGAVTLQNPRTKVEQALRTSLQIGLLQTLARNPFLPKAKFFEVGNVFNPDETTVLGLVVSGVKEKDIPSLNQEISRVVDAEVKFTAVDHALLNSHEVKQQGVYFAEISAKTLKLPTSYRCQDRPLATYKKISKFPPVVRDVTLVLDRSVNPKTIIETCRSHLRVLIIELIDSFESVEKLGDGKVALTFRLFLQDLERSLTDVEATTELTTIFQKLSDTVKFEIR